MAIDPVVLSVFNSLLSSVAEEMGACLVRASLSPNIRERRDLSCAVFDAHGRMIAQAAHIPVHLGAMPASVEAVQTLAPFAPGDLMVLNDPYLGGSHLPDVTMVSPVFSDCAQTQAHRLCRLAGAPERHRRHGARLDADRLGAHPGGLDHPARASLSPRRAQCRCPAPHLPQRPHS